MLSRLYRRLPSGFINYQNFKIMSYQNKHFRQGMGVIYALSVYFIFAIASCGTGGNKGNALETAKLDTAASPNATPFLGTGKFAYLAIEKSALNHIFDEAGHGGLHAKKIVFRFSH